MAIYEKSNKEGALLLVKTSLELDKMLADDIGDATILKLLDVEHPVAKVRHNNAKALIELAELEDREEFTSVVYLAAEFLRISTDLGGNPIPLIRSYRHAMQLSSKYLKENEAATTMLRTDDMIKDESQD
ncbi:T-complex protein 1 subunit alpha-like [Bidens hawaiensis]|uniref:T-complex protein 1 subunit alpha-like n=1 Tax=Bidens hawaiensis TaxID=980011 RepID=UPI0040498B61